MDLTNKRPRPDLVRLTVSRGEALYVRRLRKELTQAQMAEEMGTPLEIYRAWETETLEGAPIVQIQPIRPREACIVMRRRARKTQAQVAKEIGMSRISVVRMEAGLMPLTRLASHWGLR